MTQTTDGNGIKRQQSHTLRRTRRIGCRNLDCIAWDHPKNDFRTSREPSHESGHKPAAERTVGARAPISGKRLVGSKSGRFMKLHPDSDRENLARGMHRGNRLEADVKRRVEHP